MSQTYETEIEGLIGYTENTMRYQKVSDSMRFLTDILTEEECVRTLARIKENDGIDAASPFDHVLCAFTHLAVARDLFEDHCQNAAERLGIAFGEDTPEQ